MKHLELGFCRLRLAEFDVIKADGDFDFWHLWKVGCCVSLSLWENLSVLMIERGPAKYFHGRYEELNIFHRFLLQTKREQGEWYADSRPTRCW